MRKFLIFMTLSVIPFIVNGNPLDCALDKDGSLSIHMEVPHPREALVHRPNGKTVWLQLDESLLNAQIEKFELLREWVIDKSTLGTVYLNGKPALQPVINGRGKYHLYIADNTETERDNTYFMECYFEIK